MLAVVLVFAGKSVWVVYERNIESKTNLARSANALQALTDRQKSLTDKLDQLKTETGIEEEIRNKFSVAKPGEKLLVIIDDKTPTTSADTNSEKGFWAKLVEFFRK